MIKQIEFKVDFLRAYMTGDIEIKPIHEAEGEIKIIMEDPTEQSIIKKIDDYFEFYDKNIELELNGNIIYTIKGGKLYRTFGDFVKYMGNIFKIGF